MKKQIAICVAAATAIAGSAAVAKVGDTRATVVADAQTRFAKMDADKDGKVTMAELTTFMNARAAASGGDVPAKRIERRMKREDANGDGAITAAESTADAGARFDKQDANQNGTIDADEVRGGGEG